jgi:Domain of unknown function (DUF3883)
MTAMRRRAWTRDEVELVVADYFSMLDAYLSGAAFVKAEHNRRLRERVDREHGSIEFKHQNISAVLYNFEQPFLPGYPPLQNYQGLLEQAVLEWLAAHPHFFPSFVDRPVLAPAEKPSLAQDVMPSSLIVPRPDRLRPRAEDRARPEPRFVRWDFVKRDAENRRLGRMGEQWAFEFEQRRLRDEEGRPDLSERVEWVADTRGDGIGYDIQSFNADGSARLVEVKTTGLSRHFPFMVTANELRVSAAEDANYCLYRIFDFSSTARLFLLPGSIHRHCDLDPTQFRARVDAGKASAPP